MVQFFPSRGVCAAVKKENNAVKKENNAMDTTKVLTVCAAIFGRSKMPNPSEGILSRRSKMPTRTAGRLLSSLKTPISVI